MYLLYTTHHESYSSEEKTLNMWLTQINIQLVILMNSVREKESAVRMQMYNTSVCLVFVYKITKNFQVYFPPNTNIYEVTFLRYIIL